MIVKKHLNLFKAVPYVWLELTLGVLSSLLVYLLYDTAEIEHFSVPNVLPGVMGAAIAIFLGFRNSAAYGRWGEAAQTWGSIRHFSRTFARLIVTFVEAHKHTGTYDLEKAQVFKRDMIYRHLAWVTLVSMKMRDETNFETRIKNFLLSDSDRQAVLTKNNKSAAIIVLQGHHIYDAMRSGTLQGFDSFQLEGLLLQLQGLEAKCEGIKNVPIPRQYTFFTRLFVWVFILILPFSFVGVFEEGSRSWVIMPVTILLSFVFGIVERTGAVNEEPFDGLVTGIPLTAFCNQIERDLRETLDEVELPKASVAVDGFLF